MKPIVHYTKSEFYQGEDDLGEPYMFARVYALDHPTLGEEDIRTSKIIKFIAEGEFETMNTMYVKV